MAYLSVSMSRRIAGSLAAADERPICNDDLACLYPTMFGRKLAADSGDE